MLINCVSCFVITVIFSVKASAITHLRRIDMFGAACSLVLEHMSQLFEYSSILMPIRGDGDNCMHFKKCICVLEQHCARGEVKPIPTDVSPKARSILDRSLSYQRAKTDTNSHSYSHLWAVRSSYLTQAWVLTHVPGEHAQSNTLG